MGLTRACGERQVGGIYFCTGLSPYGRPLEEFLCDPPIPVNDKEMGITPIGTKLIERNGIWHVFDWVGSNNYKNVSDFVEEVRRYGLSRRASPQSDFKKLTTDSRIILLHSRAYIDNYKEYQKVEPQIPPVECPKKLKEHEPPHMKTMCARLWWQDVEGGTVKNDREVVRKMPAFEYSGLCKPEGVEPDYKVAIFASLPITSIAVINDPKSNTHHRSLKLAEEARIPVELVDE